jgi:sporulation protein YlmC with PRC-barrel domain
MLSSKGILHKLVIGLSDGKKLGEIEDLYLDPDLREVVGLYLGSEGLIKRKDKFLPRAAVQLTGIDAWLVSDSASLTTTDKVPEISTHTLVENLRGREVQTTGYKVGLSSTKFFWMPICSFWALVLVRCSFKARSLKRSSLCVRLFRIWWSRSSDDRRPLTGRSRRHSSYGMSFYFLHLSRNQMEQVAGGI